MYLKIRHRICVSCKNTVFTQIDKKTIRCTNCGLETDIRRKERFREKKTKDNKSNKSYLPVEVICICGAILITELNNPWSENLEILRSVWKNHYCPSSLTKDDLLYD